MMGLSTLVGREITDYSGRIAGTPQNHGLAVRFDVTDGFVGISQFDGKRVADRVLLSPGQMRALFRFLNEARTHRQRSR